MWKPTTLLVGALIIWASTGTALAEAGNNPGPGEINGQVFDAGEGAPLVGATISMVGRFGGTFADTAGNFHLENLPAGRYVLEFSHVGYESQRHDTVVVAAGQTTSVEARLSQKLVVLKGITVTPGRYRIMGGEPAARQTLTQSEIATVPQLGDDFFRAVQRLPGMSANDFSTRFKVRGGEYDEVLVTLDGLEVYEPFHLKDIDGGAVSVIDVASVDGIDLMTGGFPAKYGNRMSGVFDIRSRLTPPNYKRLAIGASLMNLRLLSEGSFDNNRGSWLVSARRGYIDMVLKLAGADDEVKPVYYDFFGKTRYQLSDKQVLATNFLHATDHLDVKGKDEDAGDTIRTSYGNSYAWLTLWSELHPGVTARTLASVGQVKHERYGQEYSRWAGGVSKMADDTRTFDFVGLKSDWEFDLAPWYFVRAGFEAQAVEADYDYINQIYNYEYQDTPDGQVVVLDHIDTTLARLTPSGNRWGLYLTHRLRPWERLAVELGARYDRTSYAADENWSPRANFVYDLGSSTILRAGWGRYYQSERIDQIVVGDGETAFYAAELAEHWVAGLEHDFDNGVHLRLDGYLKEYSDLRPDYRNSFDDIEIFPEAESDRLVAYRDGSTSRGLELYLKKDTGGKTSWWASYAFAKAEDRVSDIEFNGDGTVVYDTDLPTPNDQRHTLYLDWSYRPNHSWQLNLAFKFHTGWPYTDRHLVREYVADGDYYRLRVENDDHLSSRHNNYKRVDLRVNRYWSVGSGRITAFVELINVFGSKNVRSYMYDIVPSGSSWVLAKDPEYWFQRMPSFGVVYEVGV